MKTIWSKAIVVLASAALIAGCSSAGAIRNARTSLDKATAAGAEAKAPGEYYLAKEYLKAAENLAEEGDNKTVRKWAEKSAQYSGQAIQKAGGGAK